MNKQIVMGFLRHGLTTAGGMIATSGFMGIEQDNVEQLVGIGMALAGFAWSMLDKKAPVVEPQPVLPQVTPSVTPAAKVYNVNAPSGFILSAKSKNNLVGVNPLLKKVMETAIELTDIDFSITEGLRDAARQAELLDAGKSWVTKSRHQDGDAVDVAAFPADYPGDVSWEAKHYAKINEAVQHAAQLHNARVTWGGHWKQRDYVHFQFESETA